MEGGSCRWAASGFAKALRLRLPQRLRLWLRLGLTSLPVIQSGLQRRLLDLPAWIVAKTIYAAFWANILCTIEGIVQLHSAGEEGEWQERQPKWRQEVQCASCAAWAFSIFIQYQNGRQFRIVNNFATAWAPLAQASLFALFCFCFPSFLSFFSFFFQLWQ